MTAAARQLIVCLGAALLAAGCSTVGPQTSSPSIDSTPFGRDVAYRMSGEPDQGLLSPAADGSVSIAVGAKPGLTLVPLIDAINLDGVLGTEYLNLQTVTLDLRRTP